MGINQMSYTLWEYIILHLGLTRKYRLVKIYGGEKMHEVALCHIQRGAVGGANVSSKSLPAHKFLSK